ncbi:hypothetical protein BD770DRAFT_416547 [Pilaira anomala]|nr:hypothetical protein BD770DRAFT_416547 [Pilaira anomala]
MVFDKLSKHLKNSPIIASKKKILIDDMEDCIIMQDTIKKRSEEDIYRIFMKALGDNPLYYVKLVIINFHYCDIVSSRTEKRHMFYNFEKKEMPTFKELACEKLGTELSGRTMRATKKEILIEDQEDIYCAILAHAKTQDSSMDIYLGTEYSLIA